MMNRVPDRVDILLATYNGADFLDRQIRSILDDLGPACRLLIRDDGSRDATLPLVQKYVREERGTIVLLEDKPERLGPCGNFARLLERADADYVAFCDQDDVWLPGRISKTVSRIQAIEEQLGPATPVLVHTDLMVADENLRPLAPSYWKYGRLDPRSCATLNRLLVQNVVTGCATTMNAALARLAQPIPADALMHDWWVALIAAALGKLDLLDEPTVVYRRHAGSAVGAPRFGPAYLARRALYSAQLGGEDAVFRGTNRQAAAFLQRFADHLSPQQRELVQAYAGLKGCGFWERRQKIVRYRFLGSGWLRNLGWLATV